MTLIEAATGTTIAIHQERLLGAGERERFLARWTGVLEHLR